MPESTSFEEARAQAAEAIGFAASERIVTKDGVFEIPNPSLLDDDQQLRVDKLDIEAEGWDRHPDVLDDKGNVVSRGALLVPNRKGGKPVSYNTELAKAIFGDRYKAFKDAGGQGSDVNLVWTKMRVEMAKRQAEDSKSGGSSSHLAAVPDAD
jgi:hypothetical protein